MGRILSCVIKFLQDEFDGEDLNADEDGMVSFRLDDDRGHEWGCLVFSDEDSEQLMFYSVVLDTASEAQRNEVMKFVTLANYGLHIGNFELDLDDGEVRFKTSMDVEGVEVTEAICRNLMELNFMIMGRYFEGLRAVMAGSAAAADAIADIEDDDDDDDDDDDE